MYFHIGYLPAPFFFLLPPPLAATEDDACRNLIYDWGAEFKEYAINPAPLYPGFALTASELFEQKAKPVKITVANALTGGQSPTFNRIGWAGDDPGSEIVFQVVQ